MNIETIKALITQFNEAGLTKFELHCEEFDLNLEKQQEISYVAAPVAAPIVPQPASQVVNAEVNIGANVEAPKATGHVITSPMVGTFYSASSPDKPAFAAVGTKVKKGDVICIIEAMKLMNEVEAEVDGEIVEVIAKNEQMVEFGEPLFVIK